jgi:hypothetical protein
MARASAPTISEEKERLAKSGLAYLRAMGYHDIRAVNAEKGVPKPRAVFRKAEHAGSQPEMMATRDFGTFIFEVLDSVMLESAEENIEKWNLFAEYCEKKGGRLYFITFEEYTNPLLEKLEGTEIEPGFIKIKNT